jgi:alpha-galactosidase
LKFSQLLGHSLSLALNSSQWPQGLSGVCDYIHSQGLLAGICIDAGPSTSRAFGSYRHYRQHADAFAAWGLDALKADFVSGGQTDLDPHVVYPQFASGVTNNASSRTMLVKVYVTCGSRGRSTGPALPP